MESENNTKPNSLLWILLGHLCIGLGIAGFILPLLPGTPFILLASACYMRGSPQLHQKLKSHPKFGPLLTDWEAGRGIPLRIKFIAISTMWFFLSMTAIFAIKILWIRLVLAAIGIGVSTFLIRLPTKK